MSQRWLGEFEVVRKNLRFETVQTGPGSCVRRSIPEPDTTHRVEVYVDVERIVELLAGRATRSKRHQSKFMQGAVVVKEVFYKKKEAPNEKAVSS